MPTIAIKCKGSKRILISSLKTIQGDLKSLSEENHAKLRKRIETLGFDAPLFVWRNNVLDGTQRLKVLESMLCDGWSLPKGEVPVCEIQAKSLAEAKERLLGYVSQYGHLDKDGFVEFTADLEVDFSTLDFPGFDVPDIEIQCDDNGSSASIPESEYTIIVECKNEDDQQKLYGRLSKEGYECRLSTL